MDVREKLVELMRVVRSSSSVWDTNGDVADYLMYHGVTVQEWIPVKTRLPNDSATVTLCTRSRIVGTGFYNKYTKTWWQYYSGGSICVEVTHWMPQPLPPKGE